MGLATFWPTWQDGEHLTNPQPRSCTRQLTVVYLERQVLEAGRVVAMQMDKATVGIVEATAVATDLQWAALLLAVPVVTHQAQWRRTWRKSSSRC